MKKISISKSTLIVAFYLISVCSFSQSTQDSVQPASFILSDSAIHSQGVALELYKIKSNRKFILPKNKLVRVYCVNQKGRSSLKQARITEITDDQITLTPTNNNFNEVTYSESTLDYIQFTTAGTIVRGVLVNALIISATVVIIVFAVIGTLTGSPPHLGRDPWIKLDDFHKHIRFYNSKGKQKWGMRIIESVQ